MQTGDSWSRCRRPRRPLGVERRRYSVAEPVAAPGDQADAAPLRGRRPRRRRRSAAATPAFPSRRTARAYWFSTSARPSSSCRTRWKNALEQVERLEAGDRRSARRSVRRAARTRRSPSRRRRGPAPRKPWTRLSGASRMAVITGGTRTCETSTLKFVELALAGQPDGHRVGRGRRLEADREEDDLAIGLCRGQVHGVERRVDDPDVAARRLELQQIAVASRAPAACRRTSRRSRRVARRSRARRSIISSDVTQTGQPGPWTSSTSGGRIRSIPYLTMLCVCPPQTSMIVQGRVATARDRRGQGFRGRRRRDIHRGISWRRLPRARRAGPSVRGTRRPAAPRPRRSATGQSRRGRARNRPAATSGHVLQADAPGDAAEVDLAHQNVVFAVGLDDLAGDRQAHRSSYSRRRGGWGWPGRGGGGDRQLAEAEPAVVGRDQSMAVDGKPSRSRRSTVSFQEQGVHEDPSAQDDRVHPALDLIRRRPRRSSPRSIEWNRRPTRPDATPLRRSAATAR